MSAIDFYKLSSGEKREIITDLSNELDRPEYAIEKDWWVVQTLRIIMEMDIAEHIVFKGGTSLSKSWGIIDRFSEDIDIALDREYLGFAEKISRTKVGKLRDASFEYIINTFLPELIKKFSSIGINDVNIQPINVETTDQDPVQIEIQYPAVVEYTTYVLPRVILEIGSRSMLEPNTNRTFTSFIGEYYPEEFFADEEIEVPSANVERTYLDKLFLLHEEFQKKEPRVDRLSRHLYDIEKISQTEYADSAIADTALYHAIVEHRELFNRWSDVDYTTHFPPNLNPRPPKKLLPEWESDYATMQEEMIYGDSLPFYELIERISEIVDKINKLSI